MLEEVRLGPLLLARRLLLKLVPALSVGLGGVLGGDWLLRKRWRQKVPLRSWL